MFSAPSIRSPTVIVEMSRLSSARLARAHSEPRAWRANALGQIFRRQDRRRLRPVRRRAWHLARRRRRKGFVKRRLSIGGKRRRFAGRVVGHLRSSQRAGRLGVVLLAAFRVSKRIVRGIRVAADLHHRVAQSGSRRSARSTRRGHGSAGLAGLKTRTRGGHGRRRGYGWGLLDCDGGLRGDSRLRGDDGAAGRTGAPFQLRWRRGLGRSFAGASRPAESGPRHEAGGQTQGHRGAANPGHDSKENVMGK